MSFLGSQCGFGTHVPVMGRAGDHLCCLALGQGKGLLNDSPHRTTFQELKKEGEELRCAEFRAAGEGSKKRG